MIKKNKKILILFFLFIFFILLITSIIIANNYTNNEILNKEKIYYQIKYLDKKIIDISNLLNNSHDDIDWENIYENVKKIYIYWNSAILDLNNLDIDNNILTKFGQNLDNLAVTINSKDKQGSLDNLTLLYSNIVYYTQSLNYDENYTNIVYTKYYLLKAYSMKEKENWTIIYENILKADTYLYNVVNSLNNTQYSQYNVNQAYIGVKELENIINIKDISLFYFKYNIVMEKLDSI